MTLDQIEIERLLAGLSPPVRKMVEKRLPSMSHAKALSDLIAAAILDAEIAPIVDRAKKRNDEGRKAFDELWEKIRGYIRNTIRVWIRCKTSEHVEDVESQTMEVIWVHLPEYQRAQSFFITWARAYAKNQALWYKCRTLGADPGPGEEPGAEDFFELPPSACYSELLDMVQDRSPCEAISFLLNKYLDWKPAAIADECGDTPLPDVVTAIQTEIVARYDVLTRVKALLVKLHRKALLNPKSTLRDCVKPNGELIESITRWSGEVRRSIGNQVISQAKDFFTLTCELNVGPHEKLSFVWNRFLREPTAKLCAMAKMLLLELLDLFGANYAGMNDLTSQEISDCTQPLRVSMEKAPVRRLEDCSKGDLCLDILAWRDRVQAILLGPARDRHLLAYSYLCGCLPGIDGPAKRGV